jgi:hypothetical protein
MQEGMELYANFVPSPYRQIAGVYSGLLTNDTIQSQNTRCRVRLTLTELGSLSGVAHYDSLSFPFTGQFSANGIAVLSGINAKYERYLNLSFQFDADTKVITAMSDVFIGWNPVLMRSALAKTQPAPTTTQTGRWNMLLPPGEGSPQGTGFMSLNVSKTGSIQIAGQLPSGKSFTDATFLTEDGTTPVYAGLGFEPLGPRKECLTGVASFPSGRNTLISATYLWAAANDPFQIESDIFAHELISDGSRWVPPSRGQPFLQNTALEFILRNGVTEATTSHPLILTTATSYTLRPSTGETILLKVNRSTGSISGDLTLPAQNGKPKRTLKIQALAHPAANRIGGFYREKDGTVGNLEAAQSR